MTWTNINFHLQGGFSLSQDLDGTLPSMATVNQANQDQLWQPPSGLQTLPVERLTVLQAPTGYGKTSLARHWYQSFKGNKHWVTLRPEHNTPDTLFCHLIEALELDSDHCRGVLAGVSSERLSGLLSALLPTGTASHLVVIDNLHYLTAPSIDLLNSLLEKPQLKLVLTSHHHHSELLAPYELGSEVCWIQRQRLELTDVQVTELLSDLPIPLTEAQVSHYQKALHGWPAPWRMLHRRLKSGGSPTPEALSALGIHLADYLVKENISPLSRDLKELLLGLIALPDFTLDMAQTLFPRPELKFQLDALLQQQLFMFRQGDNYCFVPFFRQTYQQFLAKQDPERLALSLHAACRALIKENRRLASAQLVLELQSAVMAQEWLLKFGWDGFHHAQYQLLEKLLNLLSEKQRKHNPQLALLQGWLILEGKKDSGASNQWQKQLDPLTWPPLNQAQLTALQAETVYQFDLLDEALTLAETALTTLTSPHDLMSAMFTRAMALMWLGDIDKAQTQLQSITPLALTEQQYHIALSANIRQSNAALLKADMKDANRFAEQAHLLATEQQLIDDYTYDAIVRNRLELAIRQGELDLAKSLLADAAQTQKPRGEYWLFANHTWAMVLTLLQGRDCGSQLIQMEQRLARDFTCRRWRFRAHSAMQMAYHWRQDTNGLTRLSQHLVWRQQPKDLHDGYDNLLYIRHCLMLGKSLPKDIKQQAQAWKQKGANLLAQQLTWVYYLTQGDNKQAERQLASWLAQGYLWDAMVLGPAFANDWQRIPIDYAANPSVLDGFSRLHSLLSQLPETQLESTGVSPDPRLTKKEWRVLHCIGKGYSNDQIAAQMHVALSTVKSHINHIYTKLDINNRAEAKAEAVKLNQQLVSSND